MFNVHLHRSLFMDHVKFTFFGARRIQTHLMNPTRTTFLLIMALAATSAMAQTTEFAVGGGVYASTNSGLQSAAGNASAGGQFAFRRVDVGGSVSLSSLHKIGTAGGHQLTYGPLVRVWLHPKFFVTGMADRLHTDATVYTKNVTFIGGGGGFRLRTFRSNHLRSDDDIVFLSYEQEVKTDSPAPNRTRILGAGWRHDFHISGPAFFRTGLAFSRVRFLQAGEVWHSVSIGSNVSLIFKRQE